MISELPASLRQEQEIIADLLPRSGGDHQQHGLITVKQRVPHDAVAAQDIREGAHGGVEHEQPQHAGDGRRHGIGHDHHGAVKPLPRTTRSAAVARSSASPMETSAVSTLKMTVTCSEFR